MSSVVYNTHSHLFSRAFLDDPLIQPSIVQHRLTEDVFVAQLVGKAVADHHEQMSRHKNSRQNAKRNGISTPCRPWHNGKTDTEGGEVLEPIDDYHYVVGFVAVDVE